ncbi:Omega-6 fatty acid desaturase chloroplastic [Bienertia sinuspersici]
MEGKSVVATHKAAVDGDGEGEGKTRSDRGGVHLRTEKMKGKYGYLNKAIWNWRLMRTIMTTCHIYDKDENYVSFEKVVPEESQPISFLRKLMPDYA